MKLKELLIYGVATGLLTGCSTTSNDPELQSTEEAHNKVKELKIEQNPMIRYLFDHTAKAALMLPDPDLCGGSDELYGVLSNPIKKTIKSIWKALEKQGFSGYDVSLLETENVEWSASFNAVYANMRSLASPQTDKDFHHRFIEYLVSSDPNLSLSKEYFPFGSADNLKYSTVLFGLKFNNKALTLVKTREGNYEAVLANEFRKAPDGERQYRYFPPKIDTDIPITQEQIDEWNQVFVDTLKEDSFFGKDEETSDFDPRKYRSYGNDADPPTDTSGSTSALAALKGKSGMYATQLMVNGVAGSQIDLGLPMYVQLKGSADSKSTDGITGLIAYKLGNSVLGVVQSYANSGTGFTADSRHLESSIIAAHSFGLMFVEGQFGSVSATDVNFNDWSGVRSQVRFGIDTPFGVPFIQLTHRNFGHMSDTVGYVGFELANTEFKADTYAFSTSLLTKVGHHSVHGATGSIDWTAALNLNSGVAFTTNLTLGSALESKSAFNLYLDR